MVKKLWSREEDGQLPNWLNDEQKSRCYCDDRGWVLVHKDGNEEVIVAANTLNDTSERGHGFEDGKSKDPDRSGAHNEVSYSLSRSSQIINEGAFATITLTTTGVADNTQVPYTIEGVEAEDLQGGQLSGNFLVSGGTATLNLTAVNDSLTEGPQTITVRLGTGESITVDINDTSQTPAPPTYNLSAPASINEGENLTISLTTENVDNGPIGYQISGIQAEDLSSGSLTGDFQLSAGSADLNLTISSDLSFNEGSETLVIDLNNGEASVSVVVNDTSVATPTYSLSSNPTNSINEGQSLTITLNTQYLNDGPVGYQISGITAADLDAGSDPLIGSFNIESNTDSITLNLSEDVSFEEGNETLVLSLDNGQASINITVNDSSTATPVYTLSAPASINEGQSVTISLSTQYVSAGTVVNYTLGGSIDLANDFDSALSNTGQFVVGSNESVTLNLKSDLSFNEGNENLTLTLQDGLGSASVEIVDSSTATPSYSLSAPLSINEGESLTITLDTQNVNDGPVGYSIAGISNADLDAGSDPLTGSFTVSGSPSTDSITLNLSEDVSFEEGNETLTLTLDGDLDSVSVTVNDSSTATPSYSLSTLGNVTFVNEGDSLTISLSTQYVSNGTTIPYTIGGSVDLANDFDSAVSSTGQFVVGSSESITFNLKEDLSFEEGDETLTLSLDGLNTQISVVVKDTSKATEVYTLSAPASINEGETLSITLNTQYVSAGAVVNYTLGGSVDLANDFDSVVSNTGQFVIGTTETLNLTLDSDLSFNEGDENLSLTLQDGLGSVSVNVIDTSTALPTYTLIAPGSINEGQDLTITLNTQYVNNGPVGYQISGITAADLDAGSDPLIGDFDIQNNTDSITLKLKSDLSFNEGHETLTLTLDNGEDAISVTVNDSSTATPTYTLSAPASVNEGDTLTISLATQYVNSGTTVGYSIAGISNADLDTGSDQLNGNFVLDNNGSDSIVLILKEDLSENENDENLVLSLNNGEDSISVTIVDTSKAPVFTLSSNPLVSVNEGASLTINLSTENYSGNTVEYSVSGINANDLDTSSAALSGNFSLDGNGDGSLTFHIKEDETTEDSPEDVLVLTLTGTSHQISININDTSKTPVYNLSSSPQLSVDEGLDLVVTLQTQNVPNGDYAYNVSGIGFDSDDLKPDSDPLTGNFVVSGSPSSDTITLKLKNDYSSNEGDETITIALNNGEASIQVDVIDTSNLGSTDRGQLPIVNNDLKHPSVSDDAQYAALGSTSSNGTVEIFKYNGTGWDLLQTLPKPAGAGNAHGMATSFNSDGSVLAVGDGWTNSYRGRVFIYRRGGNGQFSLEHTIDGPHNFTTFFGHGVALSDNSLFVACTQTNKIHRYDYDSVNQQWPSSASYTLNTPVKYRDVDVSSDGLMLVAAGGHEAPFEARVWTWNGTSYADHSVVSMSTQDATLGVAISNKKLLAVGQVGTVSGTNRITLFDLDGTTWTPRPLEAWQTGAIAGSWSISKGFKIALSEPKNDGKVLLIEHEGQMRDILSTTDTYSISGPSSIDEGQDLTLTLTALGIDGQVGYSVTGISDADLRDGSAPRNGDFDVSDSTGTIVLKLKEDANSSDGSLTITLSNGEASKTVTINDITPSYTLTSSPQISVDEGVTLRISLSTENVSETTIPYSVSGINTDDLDTGSAELSGNFNLDANGDGFLDFLIKEDETTEDSPEDVLVLTLTGLGESISVNINDTSKAPIWDLSTSPVGSSINEGVDLVITLHTQNVPNGNYGYQITSSTGFGPDDLDFGSDELTGDFVVSGSPSSVTKTIKIKKDYTSGEGEETLTISLNNGEVSPITITVNDSSSIDPTEGVHISPSLNYPTVSPDGQHLAFGTDGASVLNFYDKVNGSWSKVSDIPLGTTNYMAGLGSGSFTTDSSLFVKGAAAGNWQGSNGVVQVYEKGNDGTFSLRDTVQGGNKGFGYAVAISGDGLTMVVYDDTSREIETFTYDVPTSTWNSVDISSAGIYRAYGHFDMSADAQTLVFPYPLGNSTYIKVAIFERVGQGWQFQQELTSNQIMNTGRTVQISSDGNFISLGSGAFYGGASKVAFFEFDGTNWTERTSFISSPATSGSYLNRFMYMSMTDPIDGQYELISTDGHVYYIPETLDTYSISGPSSIDEGQDLVLTLNTLGINGNVAYTISGINDADLDIAGGSASTTGNFNVSNETGSITLKLLEDADSVPGSLTITVDQGGDNEASKTVTINDITPSYILTATNTINGAINEGEDLIINLSTTNVSGSVPYEVTGNYESNDFDTGSDPLSGNFTLDQNGDSSVTFKIKADETNDGPESLTLTLTGTSNQISITINDTSIEPTTEVGVVMNYGGVPAISGDSTVMATYVYEGANSTGSTSKGSVNLFNRNPSTNEIDTTPFAIILPPTSGNQTDTTEFGRQNVSINTDGTLVAIGATGDETGKVYLYKWNDTNSVYDSWKTVQGPESTNFGFCSLSGDGNTLVVGSSGNNKVYTYTYNAGNDGWDRVFTAEFVLPANLSSVSISNTKNSLIVGSKSTNSVYTYDWNESNSSWDLRNGGLLNLQSEGYGNGLWGNMLSLTNDGNTMALSSESSTYTWHVWDWDSTNSQWVNRIVGYEDNTGNYNPLGNYIGSSAVNNGVITLAISWKRNSGAQVRLVNIPQNPS